MNPTNGPRVAFFGTAAFAVPALRALTRRCRIVAVYARPPRPAGRGRRTADSPVAAFARELAIEPRVPAAFDEDDATELMKLRPDVAVAAAYGLLIPEPMLSVPHAGFLNVHPSLLPRWRGAAPVQRAILAGDRETGVSIIRLTAKLDAGPIVRRARVALGEGEIAGEVENRLARIGADLLLEAVDAASADTLELEQQDEAGATYAEKLTREEERVRWCESAARVVRRIHALSPRPGAWCEAKGERLRILRARAEEGCGPPGVALDDALLIACGTGATRILEAQRPGKRALRAHDLLRGFAVREGERFG